MRREEKSPRFSLASAVRPREQITAPAMPGADSLDDVVDDRTRRIVEHRRRTATLHRRAWLMRRALALTDISALLLAFVIAHLLTAGTLSGLIEWPSALVFAAAPVWVAGAHLLKLYGSDEQRADHSTVDEIAKVVRLVTFATWGYVAVAWAGPLPQTSTARAVAFWAVAIVLIALGRVLGRFAVRRALSFVQTAVIVGAGDVGQLVARKLLQHPEYGIHVMGFIDSKPRTRRPDLKHLTILGTLDQLPVLVRDLYVDRVVVAFSNDRHEETLALIRTLQPLDVQVDIVPRLFEFLGPSALVHAIEGLPLVGVPSQKLTGPTRLAKRFVDIVVATVGLVITAPLFAYIAIRIKLDSEGPVFFRQTRLGEEMREFTSLKFRTLRVDADTDKHSEYIRASMEPRPRPERTGLFKLTWDDEMTSVGRWLRKTSLDELPQLVNVLRGDMSLVGPRPCIAYEVEHFAPHHFERFLVPAGLTGLWQVTARGRASFREALEMDVAYVRSYSFGLDLRLLLRTPTQMVRRNITA